MLGAIDAGDTPEGLAEVRGREPHPFLQPNKP